MTLFELITDPKMGATLARLQADNASWPGKLDSANAAVTVATTSRDDLKDVRTTHSFYIGDIAVDCCWCFDSCCQTYFSR
jgi:hypothetical protein